MIKVKQSLSKHISFTRAFQKDVSSHLCSIQQQMLQDERRDDEENLTVLSNPIVSERKLLSPDNTDPGPHTPKCFSVCNWQVSIMLCSRSKCNFSSPACLISDLSSDQVAPVPHSNQFLLLGRSGEGMGIEAKARPSIMTFYQKNLLPLLSPQRSPGCLKFALQQELRAAATSTQVGNAAPQGA